MKIVRNVLIIALALLLQSTLFGRFTIWGVKPDLAMLVLIFLVSSSGQVESVLYGFFIGFFARPRPGRSTMFRVGSFSA